MASFLCIAFLAVFGQGLVWSQVPPSRVPNNGFNRNDYGTKLLYTNQAPQNSVLQRTPRQLNNDRSRRQQTLPVNGGTRTSRLQGPINVQQRQRTQTISVRVNPSSTNQNTMATGIGMKPRQKAFQQTQQVSSRQPINQQRQYPNLQQSRQFRQQSNRQPPRQMQQQQQHQQQRQSQVGVQQRHQRIVDTADRTHGNIVRQRVATPVNQKPTRQQVMTRPREMNNPTQNKAVLNRRVNTNPRIIIRTENTMRGDKADARMMSSNRVSTNTEQGSIRKASPSKPQVVNTNRGGSVSPTVNRAGNTGPNNQAVDAFLTRFESVLTNAVKDKTTKLMYDSQPGTNQMDGRASSPGGIDTRRSSQTVGVNTNQRARTSAPRQVSGINQNNYQTTRGNSQGVVDNVSKYIDNVPTQTQNKVANRGPIRPRVPETRQVQSRREGSSYSGQFGINGNQFSGSNNYVETNGAQQGPSTSRASSHTVNTAQYQEHQTGVIQPVDTLNPSATPAQYGSKQSGFVSQPNSRSPAAVTQNDAKYTITYQRQTVPLQTSATNIAFQMHPGNKGSNQQSNAVSQSNYQSSTAGALNPVNIDPYQNPGPGSSNTPASGTSSQSRKQEPYQNQQMNPVYQPKSIPSSASSSNVGVNGDPYLNQPASASQNTAFGPQSQPANQNRQSSSVSQPYQQPSTAGSPDPVTKTHLYNNQQTSSPNQGHNQIQQSNSLSQANQLSTDVAPRPVVTVDQNQQTSSQNGASGIQTQTENQRQSTTVSQANYPPAVVRSPNKVNPDPHQSQQAGSSLNLASNKQTQTGNQIPIQHQQPSPVVQVNPQPPAAANPIVNVDPSQQSGQSQNTVSGTQPQPGNPKPAPSLQSNTQAITATSGSLPSNTQTITATSGVKTGQNTASQPASANQQSTLVTIGSSNQELNDVPIGQHPASGYQQNINTHQNDVAPVSNNQGQHGYPQYDIQYTGMPRHLQSGYGYNHQYPYQGSGMGYNNHNYGYGGPYGMNGGMGRNPNYLDPYNPPAPAGSKEYVAWLNKLDQMGIDTPYELPDSTDPPPPPTTTPAPTTPSTTTTTTTATTSTTAAPTKPTTVPTVTAAPGSAAVAVGHYPAPIQHFPVPASNLAPQDLTMTVLSQLQAGTNLEAALQNVLDTIRAQKTATTTTTTTTTAPPTTTSGFEHFPSHARSVLTGLGLTSESVKHIVPGSSLHKTLLSLIDTYVASKPSTPVAKSHFPTELPTTTASGVIFKTHTTTLAPYIQPTAGHIDQTNYVAETNFYPVEVQPHLSIPESNSILVQATGVKNIEPTSLLSSHEPASSHQSPQVHDQGLYANTVETLPVPTVALSHPIPNHNPSSVIAPVESTNAQIASLANTADGTPNLTPQTNPSVDGMLMNAIERTMSTQGSGMSEAQILSDAFNTAVQHVKSIGIPVAFAGDAGIPLEIPAASPATSGSAINMNNPLSAPSAYPADQQSTGILNAQPALQTASGVPSGNIAPPVNTQNTIVAVDQPIHDSMTVGGASIRGYPEVNQVPNQPLITENIPSLAATSSNDGTPGYPGAGSTGVDVHYAAATGMIPGVDQPISAVGHGHQIPSEYMPPNQPIQGNIGQTSTYTQQSSQLLASGPGSPVSAQEPVQSDTVGLNMAAAQPSLASAGSFPGDAQVQQPFPVQTVQQPNNVQTVQQQNTVTTVQQPNTVQTVQQPNTVQTVQQPSTEQTVQQPSTVQTVHQQPNTVQTVQQPNTVQTVQQLNPVYPQDNSHYLANNQVPQVVDSLIPAGQYPESLQIGNAAYPQTGYTPKQAVVMPSNNQGVAASNMIVGSVEPAAAAKTAGGSTAGSATTAGLAAGSATMVGSAVAAPGSMGGPQSQVIHFDVAGTKLNSRMDPSQIQGQVKESLGGNIKKELWRI